MASGLKGVAAKLQQLPSALVEEAVKQFDVIAKASVARTIGNPTMNIHTRRGRKPVKLGTKSNTSGSGSHVSTYINGTPSFAWTWLQSGTKAHDIGNEKRYLHAPRYEHPIKGPIHHPGSRGRRVWSRAVDEFANEFPDIAITMLRKAIE